MMGFLNNITQGKGKVITSALATALSALVVLIATNIIIKIAIIASAAIVTYSLLSLIHKTLVKKNDVSTQTEEQSDILEDEEYGGDDEDKEKDAGISIVKQEETEFQRQEELVNARECKRMEQGSLGGPINLLGEPLPDQVVLAVQADSKQSASQGDKSQSQSTNPMNLMKSLSTHVNVFGEPILKQPSTNISMKSEPKHTKELLYIA